MKVLGNLVSEGMRPNSRDKRVGAAGTFTSAAWFKMLKTREVSRTAVVMSHRARNLYRLLSAPIDSLSYAAQITAQQVPTPVDGAVRNARHRWSSQIGRK